MVYILQSLGCIYRQFTHSQFPALTCTSHLHERKPDWFIVKNLFLYALDSVAFFLDEKIWSDRLSMELKGRSYALIHK